MLRSGRQAADDGTETLAFEPRHAACIVLEHGDLRKSAPQQCDNASFDFDHCQVRRRYAAGEQCFCDDTGFRAELENASAAVDALPTLRGK
jgi:hypothetical protein